MSKLKMTWKKNFRHLPKWALRQAGESNNDELIVACAKKISSIEIAAGKYAHLGCIPGAEIPAFPASLLPDQQVGRYSGWNSYGRIAIRRDLPKVRKEFGPYKIPIYGDPRKGYCDVMIPRMVYQRETTDPKQWHIGIEFLELEPGTANFVFRFQILNKLNRTAPTFDDDLLFALNLLQENTGFVNVFSADATKAELLEKISVNWEILPPGEDTRQRILSLFSRSTAEIYAVINSRFDMLTTLTPVAFINGTNGFDRYFGAKFSDRLVVFENVSYGNAAYAMNQDWQVLSQLPRTELLQKRPEGFTRIIHVDGWESRLRDFVARNR